MRERPGLNWLLVAAAALPLVLVVVNFILVQENRALQAEVNRRQHAINEGAQLVRANGILVRHIAVAAVTTHDDQLRELLGRNGITINAGPNPGAAKPAPNTAGQ